MADSILNFLGGTFESMCSCRDLPASWSMREDRTKETHPTKVSWDDATTELAARFDSATTDERSTATTIISPPLKAPKFSRVSFSQSAGQLLPPRLSRVSFSQSSGQLLQHEQATLATPPPSPRHPHAPLPALPNPTSPRRLRAASPMLPSPRAGRLRGFASSSRDASDVRAPRTLPPGNLTDLLP